MTVKRIKVGTKVVRTFKGEIDAREVLSIHAAGKYMRYNLEGDVFVNDAEEMLTKGQISIEETRSRNSFTVPNMDVSVSEDNDETFDGSDEPALV